MVAGRVIGFFDVLCRLRWGVSVFVVSYRIDVSVSVLSCGMFVVRECSSFGVLALYGLL